MFIFTYILCKCSDASAGRVLVYNYLRSPRGCWIHRHRKRVYDQRPETSGVFQRKILHDLDKALVLFLPRILENA
jgi:hypothetical protein